MAEHEHEYVRDIARAFKRAGHVPSDAASHPDRPRRRGDCIRAMRPCPWVSCRYHLFLDVNRRGSIIYRSTSDVAELHGMRYTCALDAADDGGHSERAVGRVIKQTGASVREQAMRALLKLRNAIEPPKGLRS